LDLALEFPLLRALGALLMGLGLPPDPVMRTLAPPRTRRRDTPSGNVHAFLFRPLGPVWGRTSLIEYQAPTFALGPLLAAIEWLERGGAWGDALAILFGAGAMLVQITAGLLPATCAGLSTARVHSGCVTGRSSA
jgi:hypothetical protein